MIYYCDTLYFLSSIFNICFLLLQKNILEALAKGMQDTICDEIRNDPLLLRLGSILLKKLGTLRKNCIVQRLRQCARLKIQMKTHRMEEVIKRKLSICYFNYIH